jgi:integrase
MKLTEGNITKAIREARGKTDFFAWDEDLRGFGLRIRNGKRTWIFQYKIGERQHRIKLGGPELDCTRARKLAESKRGAVSEAKLGHGVDPAVERDKIKADAKPKAKGKTLASLVTNYLDAKVASMKPLSYLETKRHLEKHFQPLHDLALANIVRADVASRVREIAKASGPVAANRARASLSAMFRWAIGEGICDHNPVAGSNKQEENGPRERSLSDAEAAAVWLSAPDNDYGRIVKLILLTGCRRTEIGDLKWSEIDTKAKTITLPKERTKNGQQHVVPLSGMALEIINATPQRADRDYVFGIGKGGGYSGWSKSNSSVRGAAGVEEHWTLHDLRRTVRTGMGKLGVAPHVAEAVLNHLPEKLIRTYDRHDYSAEKRSALDQWATHVKTIVAQATGANVTTLKKKQH